MQKNLEKEALEEAGIRIIKKNLSTGSTIRYCHNHNNQIHSGIIFTYDYKIDENLIFQNHDGEVKCFEKISIAELDKILEKKLLKPNCVIPIADFF